MDENRSNEKPKAEPFKRKPKRTQKGPNQRLRQRAAVLIMIILVLGFGAAIARLSMLTLVRGSELQERAVDQQLADTTLTAKRGTIYDANGNVLAESASVWQVVMSPINFEDENNPERGEAAREAAARGLSEILGLDYENVLEKTKQKSYYTVVKRKVEVEERDKVLKLIETLSKDYKCYGAISLLDDYKRYYPHNDLASCVIGFAGSDEQGLEGVEFEYDKYLAGTPGRIITAQNAQGTDMPFAYEQNIASKDGDNIYLTIDQNVQSICEKYMAQGVAENNVLNKGVCIAMDVNTGAIKAMVVSPGYDLNKPYELSSEEKTRIDSLPENEREKAQGEALSAKWRNKAVADTYMPGSVFKVCTAAMALEEGKVTEESTFVCSGSMVVEDKTIHCHNLGGHGTQTFVEAVCNSCNPAFIQIGQLVGIQKFRDYYKGFGFSEKSGIDLPGESDDTFWADGTMSEVDFAVASFGQNFGITPIQMLTACSAVANGGYVLQPYVVSRITDSKGNVIKSVEKKIKRQIVSNTTSERMNAILGYNSEKSGSTAGYVAGYKIAAKTGTSEKIGVVEKQSTFEEDYISSLCGYAPADDPQIAMLVFFDTPSGKAYYGSQVASPVFINIMTEVLPYLEVKTNYTEEDLKYLDTSAGDYTGLTIEQATEKAKADGFTVSVEGSGEKVISQLPGVSSKVSAGGNIVLFTDEESKTETVTVPDFKDSTASDANSIAAGYGLNISFKGAVRSGGICTAQDIKEGESVPPGTVITLTFSAASSEGFND